MGNYSIKYAALLTAVILLAGCSQDSTPSTGDPVSSMLRSHLLSQCGNVSDLLVSEDPNFESDDPNYFGFLVRASGVALDIQVKDTGAQFYIYGRNRMINDWGCTKDQWIISK
jgi:hypothetical protein